MFLPFFLECVGESHNDHGNHDDGQNNMRKKYGQIKSFDPTKIWKFSTAMMVVVEEVAYEKNAGKNKRRHHALFMTILVFFLDKIITNNQ